MIRVLQISSDYVYTDLYKKLFQALLGIGCGLRLYCPVVDSFCEPRDSGGAVDEAISPCFHFWDRGLFYRKQRKIIRDLCGKEEIGSYDLIHSHFLFTNGNTALELKKRYGVPYITAVRNTDINEFFKYMLHLRRKGLEVLKEAERVVFLSGAYQRKVLKYVPVHLRKEILDKSVIIPNGLDPFWLENKNGPRKALTAKDEIHLVFAGEVNRNKNVEAVIKAALYLQKKGLRIRLTVAGTLKSRKIGMEMERHPWISYVGRQDKRGLLGCFREGDIFVMPSRRETFGLVYGEAMSQGLPVIYTRGEGFDGQFPEGAAGFSVDPGDPAEIGEKILEIAANYKEISDNCPALAQRFDWNDIAKEYMEIYKEIIEGKNE